MAGFQDGISMVTKKLFQQQLPGSLRGGHSDSGPESQKQRREVRAGSGGAQVSTQGGPVPNLGGAEHSYRIQELGSGRAHLLRTLDLGRCDQGAQPELPIFEGDLSKLLQVGERNQMIRLLRTTTEINQDIRSPGQG